MKINQILVEAIQSEEVPGSPVGISLLGGVCDNPKHWTSDFGLRFLTRLLDRRNLNGMSVSNHIQDFNASEYSCLFARHMHEIQSVADHRFIVRDQGVSVALLRNYWLRTYQVADIGKVIFGNTPHHLFDYVALQVARENKIQTLVLNELREFPDRVFLSYEVRDLCYFALNLKPAELESTLPIDPQYVTSWLAMLRRLSDGKGSDTVRGLADRKVRVLYTKGSRRKRLSGYIRIVARFWSPYGLLRKVLDKQLLYQSKRELAAVTSRSVPTATVGPYVYFPLHQQPEATTCPRAGAFVDQRRIVQTLLDGTPETWKVIVKEHPDQFLKSYPRKRGFYRELCSDSRVLVAPIDTSSVSLLKGAVAVVTAGSSAVGQALSLRKPVLLFGYSPFSAHRSVRRIWTSSDISRFVQEHESHVAWEEKEDEEFIRKVLRRTFVGCLSSMNGLSQQQWKNQSAPLLRFLKSWVNESKV